MKIKFAFLGIALSLFSTDAYTFSCNPSQPGQCPQGNASCGDTSGCNCGPCTIGSSSNYWYCADQAGNGSSTIWNYTPSTQQCGSVYQTLDYAICPGDCYFSSKPSKHGKRKLKAPSIPKS